MTRRELREQVFLLLFRPEFYDSNELMEQMNLPEVEEQMDMSEADANRCSNEEKSYILTKCGNIIQKLDEIDASVNAVSEGWKTRRMGKSDLALIRLAVYEMKYEEDIPERVAINEAVELAKRYGTDNSPSFINGVLAKLV